MSFFPPAFNPRDEVVMVLPLCNINTPDGDFGFLVGIDGKFTDVNGKTWWGTSLVDHPEIKMSLNGTAPAGQMTLAWFDDPTQRDPGDPGLISEVKDLGVDYIAGRPITFYIQPLTDMAQLYDPVIAPIPYVQYEMRALSFSLSGPATRSITLHWEGVFAGRNEARGWFYTTTDHAKLTGSANPSLSYAPMDARQPEKLF
jgi:hypothetical protein